MLVLILGNFQDLVLTICDFTLTLIPNLKLRCNSTVHVKVWKKTVIYYMVEFITGVI